MNNIDLYNIICEFNAHLKNQDNKDDLLSVLIENNLLSENYENRYLNTLLGHSFDISKIDFVTDENQIIAYLDDNQGCPYKMVFKKYDIWRIDSTKFQCQSCFGEDPECNVCGGEGWGVL